MAGSNRSHSPRGTNPLLGVYPVCLDDVLAVGPSSQLFWLLRLLGCQSPAALAPRNAQPLRSGYPCHHLRKYSAPWDGGIPPYLRLRPA